MSAFAPRTSLGPARLTARISDPSIAAALFFAGFAVLLSAVAGHLLLDPDSWWHVAVGREIVASGSLPWTDTFSHTFRGERWIAKEWLSQLLFYGAYAIAGWPGVAILTALTIAAAFGLLLSWLLRRIRWTVALTLTVVAASLAAPHFLARPHIFSWPLLVIWMAGLLGAVDARKAPSWWLLTVVVLWSNLHASLLLAFAIALPLGLEATVRAKPEYRLKVFTRWAAFGSAALGAAMVSPYGPYPFIVAIQLFGSGEPLNYITEWQPLGFDGMGLVGGALFAFVLCSLCLQPKHNVFRIVVLLFIAYLTVRHSRFLNLFAIVASMIVAWPLVRRFPAMRPSPDMAAATRPNMLGALPVTGGIVASMLLVTILAPAPAALITPAAALAEARKTGVTGNVFNSYNFGGYLIFAGEPTFIDGRTDQLFLGGFFSELQDTMKAADDSAFFAMLDRYETDWAIVEPNGDAARHFENADGWRAVYADSVAEVYVVDR